MSRLLPDFILDRFKEGSLSGRLDAYTMFADISGFTEMTGRLMAHGKEGAEILSNIINDIFTPSIRSVYDNGGFVSSFAGDAFSSVFAADKADHALNAALSINRLFRQQGLVDTKHGTFNLSVKIGLSFGDIEYRIIETELQNTWYFKGEAVDSSALGEHKASKMQIVADRSIARKLSSFARLKPLDNDFYLVMPGDPVMQEKEIKESLSTESEALFFPPAVTEIQHKGEFREIASCFVNLKEDERLDEFVRIIIKKSSDFGGYFSRIYFGDKGCTALIIFGAPVGKENLYRRVCDFALCLGRIKGLCFRAGITAGFVFAGFVGSGIRSEYTVLGDVVNLSARIMMSAKWMGIYADKTLKDKLSGIYSFQYAGSYSLKGFKSKKELYVLRAESKKGIQYTGSFIGRKREMKRLDNFLSPALRGENAGIIYIEGPAGIGKSRFIDYFSNLHEECSFFNLPCDEILKKSFNPFASFLKLFFKQDESKTLEKNFQAFNNIYKNLVDMTGNSDVRNELVRTRSVIGALIDLEWENSLYSELDGKGKYENTLYSVKNLINALSLIRPVMLVIEDAQWIDSDSTVLLNLISKASHKLPIGIIALCRPDDDGRAFKIPGMASKGKRIKLAPFDRKALKELMLDRLNTDRIPEESESFIWDKSEGNPFFAEQIILFLYENNLLDKEFRLENKSEDIPSGIAQIIVARIDRLSAKLKETLKTASVLGRVFAVNILEKMLRAVDIAVDEGEFREYLEEGCREQIWESLLELNYIFRHSLIRDALYEIQLKKTLRRLHGLAGAIMEDIYADNLKPYYEDLADHYEKAENLQKTLDYLEKSADSAKKEYRNIRAIELYDHLLKYIDKKEKAKYIEVLIRKGQILELTGSWRDAEKAYRKAWELSIKAGDMGLQCDCLSYIGFILTKFGRHRESLDLLHKSLSIARELHDKQRIANALNNIGITLWLSGESVQAMEYYKNQLSICEETGDKTSIAYVTGNMGILYSDKGDYAQALALYEKQRSACDDIRDRRGVATALCNIGIICSRQGNYSKAKEFYEKSMSISLEIGDKHAIIDTHCNMAEFYFRRGDFQKAIESYNKQLKNYEDMGDKNGLCIALGNLGVVYTNIGDYKRAADYYHRQLLIAEQLGSENQILTSLGYLGDVYCFLREYDKAMDYCRKQLEMSKNLGMNKETATALGIIGNIHLNRGDYQRAKECYEEKLSICRYLGDRHGISFCFTCLGQIFSMEGRYEESAEYHDKAIAISRELNTRYVLCEQLCIKAECMIKMSDTEKALRLFDEGLKIAVEINKKDVILNASIIKYKLENNIKALSAMLLDKKYGQEEKAIINYELWKLTGLDRYRTKARNLYKGLLEKKSRHDFRQRLEELQ